MYRTFRSLLEEGIQVRKFLFLREKDFKFLEFLRKKFLRRAGSFWKDEKEAVKISAGKAVERGTVNEGWFDREEAIQKIYKFFI